MGRGKGIDVNLDLILRIVELILLIVGIAFFMIARNSLNALISFHQADFMEAFDAMCISASIYVIILLILVFMKIIKGEEQDQKFVGWLSALGAVLMISTGIAVCIFSRNNTEKVLISGIMAILGGAALVVDALKDFNVF